MTGRPAVLMQSVGPPGSLGARYEADGPPRVGARSMKLPTEPAISDLARLHGKEILARGLPYAQSALGPGRVHAALTGGSGELWR